MPLTKNKIKDEIYRKLDIPYYQSNDIVESLIEIIKRTLSFGNDLLISGFGKFCVKTRKEKLGRNPATGERMKFKAHKTVTFHVSKKLTDKLNNPPS